MGEYEKALESLVKDYTDAGKVIGGWLKKLIKILFRKIFKKS